ncbi:MAG: CDP-alcohol phosphatidyltransferase family protein [Verrucomicrobia bacterium]|nr:CDP-alcohol phosphatidyltransferase family protein [Verrucomicrobiota bacterium]MDA1087153.1 CDP-alcohol phosphatidyltransferase family protein [Verrucomicrobiota bacterium]
MTEDTPSPHRSYPAETFREIYKWDIEHNPGGIFGKLYLRRWSVSIIRILAPLPVAPNHLTYGSLLASVAALVVLYKNFPMSHLVGAAFIQLCLVLGYADGDMVRLKHLGNRFGGWLDGVIDMMKINVVYFAVAAAAYADTGDAIIFLPLSAVISTRLVLAHIARKTHDTFANQDEDVDSVASGGMVRRWAERLGIKPEFASFSDDVKFFLLTIVVLLQCYMIGLIAFAALHTLLIAIAFVNVWRKGRREALANIGFAEH